MRCSTGAPWKDVFFQKDAFRPVPWPFDGDRTDEGTAVMSGGSSAFAPLAWSLPRTQRTDAPADCARPRIPASGDGVFTALTNGVPPPIAVMLASAPITVIFLALLVSGSALSRFL